MLPEEFLTRMKKQLGEDYALFLKSYDNEEFHGLRLNPLKGDKTQSLLMSSELVNEENRIDWEENGFYYDNNCRPGKHPFHDMGLFYIQEPSAMLPARLLDVREDQKILDMCAAPGGKTTQIASLLKGTGLLVSNEIHPKRAKILSENVERMGVRNALVLNETPEKIGEYFVDYFDRVLVDAPCSGEGMFRKNDNAVNEWSSDNVTLCANRQDDILNKISRCLKIGGIMVYSTCTFSYEENEGTIRRFVASHSDYRLISMVRLFPHYIKGEGHFAAVLLRTDERTDAKYDDRKTSCEDEIEVFIPKNNKELGDYVYAHRTYDFGYKQNYDGFSKGKQIKALTAKQNSLFIDFAEEMGINAERLLPKGKGIYHKFGDYIYLAPENMPGLSGLKVVRAGLCLGNIEKDRFKPSHSLALALGKDETSDSYELKDENELINYLKGMTFSCEKKGWQLITFKGYSVGFGKGANGVMKNHYPKGLRKN